MNKAYYRSNPYETGAYVTGTGTTWRYVTLESVQSGVANLSDGNEKVGKVLCFNLPAWKSCRHDCECFQMGKCYAHGGCYNFASNQAGYAENLRCFIEMGWRNFADKIIEMIAARPSFHLFRWFTVGDIYNMDFFRAMVAVAEGCPGVKFWFYTKKYTIVNRWCRLYGVESIPENLTCIFSHWMNEDGTYLPMENPYDFPTSEFIPVGREELAETVTHICPCSNPDVLENCETCSHACYDLKHGQSMALLEHSTADSKERDKVIRAAHAALKKNN